MSTNRHARSGGERRGLRDRRGLFAAIAAALALGWLAWNVLLVESDVATVAEGERAVAEGGR